MEKQALQIMDQIDAMGGSVEAIENGYMQEQIAKSAYAYQRAIEDGGKIIVGVNKFTQEETQQIPVFKVDNSIQQTQVDKLKIFRSNRDQAAADQSLIQITEAAVNGTNLMPVVIEAVEKKCTLGEISDALRKVFGEYR